MRMSRLFCQTLHEAPSEAKVPSHNLLLRAGFIRQLAAGIFSYLPLGRRSLFKIETIIRQEMDRIGGQEIKMPVVHPADIWKATGRWFQIDAEMGRFKDRSGREMALAMTHEEVVADLVGTEIRSYRQLPQLIYHIQTKWRDDPRPRAGLIRMREFTMKDSYSLDADWQGLDQQYRAHYQAYFNIFQRCGLPVIAVKSDVGMMGGQLAHEFMYLTSIGEDTIIICHNCGFSANRQVARFRKNALPAESLQAIKKVATPECKTIDELAHFLKVPKARTAKAVFMVAEVADGSEVQERFIFALVRGDMEVNETKLANAVGARALRPATDVEIRSTGAVPGYASPVGLHNLTVIADDAIPESHNLVSGANEEGYHFTNVNYERDFQADLIADIALAQDGDGCEVCGGELSSLRGVEVGNIFKLGTRYSHDLGCTYLDAAGQSKPVVMGSYGIGSDRLLACVAEEHHDAQGLVWPVTVAPYHVHLVLLAGKGGPEPARLAQQLYTEFDASGIEVLFDDRPESPGVKFNDADLIGLPIRLTVSERSIQAGGVEFKRRDQETRQIVAIQDIKSKIQETLADLWARIDSGLCLREFSD